LTLQYHHLNEVNNNLTFRMKQYNSGWMLPFNESELPHLEEDNCFSWKVHYILESIFQTTTIILPMNGVNLNWPNNNSQTFTRKFYCFIQKVKFLLVLVLNDSIQVPTEWGPYLDTSIPSFKRSQQEFNLLNGTKELSDECLGTVVWQVCITPSIER